MDNPRLGGVIRSLHLRKVDNMTAHRRRGHKAPIAEVLQRLPVQVSPLFLLSLPVGRGRPSAVEGPVEVNPHHLGVVAKRAIDHGALCPRHSGIGDKDVQTAVEVLDALVNGLLHGRRIGDVTLVCLGWMALASWIQFTFMQSERESSYSEHHISGQSLLRGLDTSCWCYTT